MESMKELHRMLGIVVMGLGMAAIAQADGLDDLIAKRMQERQIIGLSLAIIEGGKIVKAQGYGFYEVRAKLPCARGTWPAIWLLPTGGNWPDEGEIDLMEMVGWQPEVVHATLHTGAFNHMRGTQRGEDYAAIKPLCLVRASRDFGESANPSRTRRLRQFIRSLLRGSYSRGGCFNGTDTNFATFVGRTLVVQCQYGATRLAS